jgi:hypothetical protein
MVDRGSPTYTVISNSAYGHTYFMEGKMLKILSNSSMMSEPMTCGSYSSGYMESKEWYLQTGAVFISSG